MILITSKRYRYDFTFSILLVGLTVATNAALIPSLGMNGAAIATMITVVVYNLIRMAFVWKFSGYNLLQSKTAGWSSLLQP